MAQIKLKIKIIPPGGVAHVNVIETENDNYWEIRHPQTEAIVEIPDGQSRYVFVNVLASIGTEFELSQDDRVVLKKKTDSNNAFGGYVIVHA